MSSELHLPKGFSLNNFVVKSLRGGGGSGFTYVVKDTDLDEYVALKEYFPSSVAIRNADMSVSPRPPEYKYFQHHLESFIKGGQIMARFAHESLVRVLRVFIANGTAYIVTELVGGPNLDSLISERTYPSNQLQIDRFLNSVLTALEVVHRNDLLHGAISPENIVIRAFDGLPIMIDFNYRSVFHDEEGDSYSNITRYYSAIEQYSDGVQGPWTDIYAIAATVYRVITGEPPVEASARMDIDSYVPIEKTMGSLGDYRPKFLKAINWGLSVLSKDRPQSVVTWREMLFSGVPKILENKDKKSTSTKRREYIGTKIFISYRRFDSSHIAGRVYDRLRPEFGEDQIFYDVDDIPPGVDFRSHIQDSIIDSAVMLAIIGKAWINPKWKKRRSIFSFHRRTDDFIQIEMESAMEIGVPILPVLIDNTLMPTASKLPPSLKSFVYLHASSLRAGRDFHADMDGVINTLHSIRDRGNSGD